MKADIAVVLDQSVVVPTRTEMILEGKLVRLAKSEVGMISPLENSKISNEMHVANTVVCPNGRNVFLRVMNSKSEPSELKFGTRVATFSPLVQSHGKSGSASSSVKAETVGDNKAKFNREFTLYTDASDVGLGFVLSQHDDNGIERVVAYESRSLTPRERNYATTEKEALAIHYGTQYFRLYLLGRKFTIVTDHNALRWLNTIEPKGRLARWLMDLQEFEFSVQHRAGKSHCNADALSRLVK
jgi:hypothetical protein